MTWSAFEDGMSILTDEKQNCIALVCSPLFKMRGDPEQYMAYWRGNGTKAPTDGIAPRIPDYNTVYPTVKAAQLLCERYLMAVQEGTMRKF